jgi:predicted transcriptional regulator
MWAEGVPGVKMHRMVSVQYGNSVLSQRIVCELVYVMILQNRQVTLDEVAHQLQISRGSANESIHNRHAFHKVCAWWVP